MAQDDATRNPFTRPGFIAAAAVIALVVVLAIVLGIINATRSDETTTPSTSATTTAVSTAPSVEASTQAPAEEEGDSVCGLKDGSQDLPAMAPDAMWAYQGTTAYPTSKEYGPGADDPAGFRYCFPHSPIGALFFAANAATQGSDPAVNQKWLEYAVGSGAYRDEILNPGSGDGGSGEARLNLQGFRVLDYTPSSARVDLGVRVALNGEATYISGVYDLVWEDGDWKINADSEKPIAIASIPDLVGYTPWGE